jgi:pimeloyl-ACP methyl ester carboxylesterase
VAYALAVKYPSLVTRLIVEEELIPGFRVELSSEGARRYPTWHGPFHAARSVPELLIPGNEREYLGLFWDLTFEPGTMEAADVEEYLRAYTKPDTLRCWLAYYREAAADAEWNLRAATKSLSVPVLTLGGEAVMGAAVGASLRHVARDVRHVTLARCGHYPSYERPLEVADRVTAFLDSPSPLTDH